MPAINARSFTHRICKFKNFLFVKFSITRFEIYIGIRYYPFLFRLLVFARSIESIFCHFLFEQLCDIVYFYLFFGLL